MEGHALRGPALGGGEPGLDQPPGCGPVRRPKGRGAVDEEEVAAGGRRAQPFEVAERLVEAWLAAAESWAAEGVPFHLVFVW